MGFTYEIKSNQPPPLTASKLAHRIAVGITVLGLIGFAGAFLCAMYFSKVIPRTVQMPMAELDNIAVDDSGHIYCISSSYYRLQAFDNKGRFLWGAYTGECKTSDQLWVDASAQIHVLSTFVSQHRIFDSRGKLLKQVHVSEKYAEQLRASDVHTGSRATDKSGNRYTVDHPSIWPTVIRTSPSGKRSAVISPIVWLWPLTGPLPALFFFAAGS
ncbi:MAG TPA: hypothetical protein VGK34_07640, partial [Armatimonadota bacterium]